MSRDCAKDYVVHADYELGAQCKNQRERDGVWSRRREDVTCKRCLAALARLEAATKKLRESDNT